MDKKTLVRPNDKKWHQRVK
jgi:hypothetical protein